LWHSAATATAVGCCGTEASAALTVFTIVTVFRNLDHLVEEEFFIGW
jgi:hypothetical protein